MTTDISTSIGKVRLLIGDNVLTDIHFSDAEIEYFLSDNGNSINLAAASALEAWAAAYSTGADSEKIGDYSYTQTIVTKMLTMAAKFREREATTPAVSWGEFNFTNIEES